MIPAYDSHLLQKELDEFPGKISFVAKAKKTSTIGLPMPSRRREIKVFVQPKNRPSSSDDKVAAQKKDIRFRS
uniref:Uncharacterized protein n=1 Tax=Parascaris univalens TaxID=6257 RepID=A0A915AX14_PARUN